MSSAAELKKLKVADLKQLLTDKGLDNTGVKDVLVERLLAAQAGQESTPAAETEAASKSADAGSAPAEPAPAAAATEAAAPAEPATDGKEAEAEAPGNGAPELDTSG